MKEYLTLFRNEYYRKFLIAMTVLQLGRKISWIALAWFVYEVTGSALSIGTVIFAATISPLLSSIFVGGILDSYDRRKIMIIENIIRGSLLLCIPLLYWFEVLSFSMIIIVVVINGILSSFTTIGTSSILPSFISEEELETANALFTMSWQLAFLIGPAIGGLCIAAFGSPVTILLDVVAFYVASFLYYKIPKEIYHHGMESSKRSVKQSTSFTAKVTEFWKSTKLGFAFIGQHRVLIVLAVVTLLFNFAYGPLEPMFPIYVDKVLQSGPEVLGFMWTFFALGSLLGAFLWIRFKKDLPYSYALGGVIILWSIVPFMLTLVDMSILVYGLMFFGGISYAPYNIVAPTLRQRLVPNDIRGRVFGVYGLIGGLGLPLGVYLGGILGEWYGPIYTLVIASIFTFCLGVFVYLHPALRFKDAKELKIRKV